MVPPARPPAKMVGDEFAKSYYTVLKDYPQHLSKFYEKSSKIGRTGNNGMMGFYTLLDIDDENLNMLSYGGFDSAEVTSIISKDCQGGGGVLVVVCGYSTLKETLKMMNFIQVFLLAPQKEGYFVLIDMLHFDDQTIVSASNVIEEEVAETEVSRKEVAETEVSRKEVAEPEVTRKEVAETEVTRKEVTETEVSRKEVAEVLETEVTRKEVGDGLLGVSEPSDGREDVSKISDASADVKVIQNGQGQHPSCDPNDDTGNGNNQESQVLTEGSTVHVRNLPPNDTFAKVEDKFKTFGPIREIRVKNPGLDYYYAFVEFKEANAAKRAIKASPVEIDGRNVPVAKARGGVRSASLAYDYSRGHCLISKPIDPHARPSAKEVGDAFAKIYYLVLQDYPHLLYRVYQDNSTITRPGEGGMMRDSTLLSIDEDLDMLHYGRFDSAEVTSVISQDSRDGGVLVVVRGYFTLNKRHGRNFTQTFFLAPNENGYFVFTDFFNFGTEVNDFWDWQKSNEEQSKRQEEGGTGVDHSRDYEQVMEEQRKLQEEKMKLQEETMKLQEEKTKFQEEKMKLQEEKTKFQEEKMKLQEEKMKFQEEKMKFQEETMKFQEEKMKFQEEKMKFQEEKMKFQEEKMKFQEEKTKFQEEKTKFQEEKMKFQEEKMKFQEETMKLQEEKTKLQEEQRKLKEEEENQN